MFIDILNNIDKNKINLKGESIRIEKKGNKYFNFIDKYNDEEIINIIRLYPYITNILNIVLFLQKRQVNRNNIIEIIKERINITKQKDKEKYLEKKRQGKVYNPKTTLQVKINNIKEKADERLNTYDEKTKEMYDKYIEDLNEKLNLSIEEQFDFFGDGNINKNNNTTKIYLNNFMYYIDNNKDSENNQFYHKMYDINNIYFIFLFFASFNKIDDGLQKIFIDIFNKLSINNINIKSTINKTQAIIYKFLGNDIGDNIISFFANNIINEHFSLDSVANLLSNKSANFSVIKNNILLLLEQDKFKNIINKFIKINMYYTVYLFKYLFYNIEDYYNTIYNQVSGFFINKFIEQENNTRKINKQQLEHQESIKKIIIGLLKISYIEYYIVYNNKLDISISDIGNISFIIGNIGKKEISLIDFIVYNDKIKLLRYSNNLNTDINNDNGNEKTNMGLNLFLNKLGNSILNNQKIYLQNNTYKLNLTFLLYFNAYIHKILYNLKEDEYINLKEYNINIINEDEDENENENENNKYETKILDNNYSVLFRIRTNIQKYIGIKYNGNTEDKKINIYNIEDNQFYKIREIGKKILNNNYIQELIIKSILGQKKMNFKYKKYKLKNDTNKLIFFRFNYLVKEYNNDPENKLIKEIIEDILYNNKVFLPIDIPASLYINKVPLLISIIYDKKNEYNNLIKEQALQSILYNHKIGYFLSLFLIDIKPIKKDIFEVNFTYENVDIKIGNFRFKLFNSSIFNNIFTGGEIPKFVIKGGNNNVEVEYVKIKNPIIDEIKNFIEEQGFEIISQDKIRKNKLSTKLKNYNENIKDKKNNSIYIKDPNFNIRYDNFKDKLFKYLQKLFNNIILNNLYFINVKYFLYYVKNIYKQVPIFYFSEDELTEIKNKTDFVSLKEEVKNKIKQYLFIIQNREIGKNMFSVLGDSLFNLDKDTDVNTLNENDIFNGIKTRLLKGVKIKDYDLLIFDTYANLLNLLDDDDNQNFIKRNKKEIYTKIISYIIKDYLITSNKILKYYKLDETIFF